MVTNDPSDHAGLAERPVLLICTVGGSPQPIATALRVLRPDVVWFLVSGGKAGESSRSQVVSEEIDYDKPRGIRGPGLRFAEGCPEATKIIEMPADDPDGAYKICWPHLAQARKSYSEHRLIADYTGGTKSMTGALLMAALAQPGVEVQFMVGERADLVQVKTGSEKPQRMAADFIVAERDFAAAEQAVDGYDYAAAQLLLHSLRDRLKKTGVKPPRSWSHRLEQALAWTGVMSNWDAFNHGEAAARQAREPAVRAMLQESDHLAPLLALSGRQKGKPGWDICTDLWLNALRRGERGRHDDAVARLYRLVEAAAQAHLWEKHGLESGKVAPHELPDRMRDSVYMKTDHQTQASYAALGLNHTVELLRARDPHDRLVAAYGGAGAGEDRAGPPWLTSRNNSILAHGFVTVDEQAWEQAKNWVETNLMGFFESAGFPQLPRHIPWPKTTAV
jgi:CRISPR-associated protein (TIGR02710 family)